MTLEISLGLICLWGVGGAWLTVHNYDAFLALPEWKFWIAVVLSGPFFWIVLLFLLLFLFEEDPSANDPDRNLFD